ncbi:hypothetical protein AYI68_g7018, partial [Smittium mucronatum]
MQQGKESFDLPEPEPTFLSRHTRNAGTGSIDARLRNKQTQSRAIPITLSPRSQKTQDKYRKISKELNLRLEKLNSNQKSWDSDFKDHVLSNNLRVPATNHNTPNQKNLETSSKALKSSLKPSSYTRNSPSSSFRPHDPSYKTQIKPQTVKNRPKQPLLNIEQAARIFAVSAPPTSEQTTGSIVVQSTPSPPPGTDKFDIRPFILSSISPRPSLETSPDLYSPIYRSPQPTNSTLTPNPTVPTISSNTSKSTPSRRLFAPTKPQSISTSTSTSTPKPNTGPTFGSRISNALSKSISIPDLSKFVRKPAKKIKEISSPLPIDTPSINNNNKYQIHHRKSNASSTSDFIPLLTRSESARSIDCQLVSPTTPSPLPSLLNSRISSTISQSNSPNNSASTPTPSLFNSSTFSTPQTNLDHSKFPFTSSDKSSTRPKSNQKN